MAETTVLRSSGLVRNAAVGALPPHGQVKTGELPLVQVKMAPGGPQVLSPQPKAVQILPPRDAHSAMLTGGLPRVNVKMTAQGPQIDDGQNKAVLILPPKGQKQVVAAGGLPMVQVKMTQAGPQVQNVPNIQAAPPQIQNPQPVLSQPKSPRVGVSSSRQVVRVAAPSPITLPPMPEFPADQLMLCRHLVNKYLVDQRAVDAAESTSESTASSESSPVAESDVAKLAAATIATIDQALVTVAVRAEAEALAAASDLEVQELPAAPVPVTPGVSVIPAAPSASYVAGRVGGRTNGYAIARPQRNAAMAPRRVSRGLPPVIVKMEGRNAVVQNKAEVDAARAAIAAQGVAAAEVSDGNALG